MSHHKPDVDVTPALEALAVPSAVVGRDGRIRWLNRGATELIGERVGRAVRSRDRAGGSSRRAHQLRAGRFDGETASTNYTVTLLARDGRRLPVTVSSVPFWERGEITGVFGVACPDPTANGGSPPSNGIGRATRAHDPPIEALALLAEGLGTRAIAARLGIAEETARNHIRGILIQLGVHSRLEAVVHAYRLGLLEPSRD